MKSLLGWSFLSSIWHWVNVGQHANALAALGAAAAAIATAFGVAVSFWFLRRESRQSRIALGVDTLLKFDARFSGDDMQQPRKDVAGYVLTRLHVQQYGEEGLTLGNPLPDEVLDFFDTIGYLTRMGTLDINLVYNTFYAWVQAYWIGAQEYIKDARIDENDNTVWIDFEWLYKNISSIRKRKSKYADSDLILSREKLNDLFEYEIRREM